MEKKRHNKTMKQGVLAGVMALSLLSMALTACVGKNGNAAATGSETTPYVRGNLNTTVDVAGSVRARQSAVLGWMTAGTVAEISVEQGALVAAGDPIMRLADESLASEVLQAQVDVINAQKKLDDLLENDDAFNKAHQAYLDAQKALIEAQTANEEFLKADFEKKLEAAADKVKKAETRLSEATYEFEKYADRAESDATRKASEKRLLDAQLAFDKDVRDELALQLKRDQAAANVAAAETWLATAKVDYEKYAEGPDPDAVAMAEAELQAAKNRLAYQNITAPFGGTVTGLFAQPGDVVSAGSKAVQVEDLSSLFLDVSVSELDINRIAVGQVVEINFDAISDATYHGVVRQVAMTGTKSQSVVDYPVNIEIIDADAAIKPGMTAIASIVVAEKQGVYVLPGSAIVEEAGGSMVYVLRNGVPVAVQVVVGESNALMSEIVSAGISDGEAVLLTPPAGNTSTEGSPVEIDL